MRKITAKLTRINDEVLPGLWLEALREAGYHDVMWTQGT